MTTYRVKVLHDMKYNNLLIIKYRKDFKYLPTPTHRESITRSELGGYWKDNIEDMPVADIIKYVKIYMRKIVTPEETIVEFKMES